MLPSGSWAFDIHIYLLLTHPSIILKQKNSFSARKKLEIIVVNWFESIFDVTKVCLKNQSKPWLREMAPRRRREMAIFTLQHSNFDYFHTALWIQAQKRVPWNKELEMKCTLENMISIFFAPLPSLYTGYVCFCNHSVFFSFCLYFSRWQFLALFSYSSPLFYWTLTNVTFDFWQKVYTIYYNPYNCI